eukprot:TRINITY_DN6819_c0_g1_i1.p1 TRINITY_DN6819_c0_g1~~TRINITY_DN6819_c0_g1_i1.p1  ORF type:complete len:369 (-),score=41.33 TRINITY_DN6819_c0_g1_i1:61-1167(-)
MRLVDVGALKLTDPASQHIDGVMQNLTGDTFVGLFGPVAANVTVGQLLAMQSGVGDFDVPYFDNEVLNTGDRVHSPAEQLRLVAGWTEPLGCTTGNCSFVCRPGNCTSYSSTNYILAGLVVLAHSNNDCWSGLDMAKMLGIDLQSENEYPHTDFLSTGRMNDTGLTVPGSSLQYGQAELYDQDASILGWTCGNVAASGLDVARFYYNVLGPSPSIVTAASVEIMKDWSVLNVGWARGCIDYGHGLMIQNVSPNISYRLPPVEHVASYVGHGGDTYGFLSDNGWFPTLETAISVIVNQDSDYDYPSYVITCAVVEIVAKYRNITTDLQCRQPNPDPLFKCVNAFGHPTCFPTHAPNGMNKTDCSATCQT